MADPIELIYDTATFIALNEELDNKVDVRQNEYYDQIIRGDHYKNNAIVPENNVK